MRRKCAVVFVVIRIIDVVGGCSSTIQKIVCTTTTWLYTQQRMNGKADKYSMALAPFSSWIQRRQITIPEADKLLPLISQSGATGISRGELGKAIKLDRQVLDEFLDGLVAVGVVRVGLVNGIRVYRAAFPEFIGR